MPSRARASRRRTTVRTTCYPLYQNIRFTRPASPRSSHASCRSPPCASAASPTLLERRGAGGAGPPRKTSFRRYTASVRLRDPLSSASALFAHGGSADPSPSSLYIAASRVNRPLKTEKHPESPRTGGVYPSCEAPAGDPERARSSHGLGRDARPQRPRPLRRSSPALTPRTAVPLAGEPIRLTSPPEREMAAGRQRLRAVNFPPAPLRCGRRAMGSILRANPRIVVSPESCHHETQVSPVARRGPEG